MATHLSGVDATWIIFELNVKGKINVSIWWNKKTK